MSATGGVSTPLGLLGAAARGSTLVEVGAAALVLAPVQTLVLDTTLIRVEAEREGGAGVLRRSVVQGPGDRGIGHLSSHNRLIP